MKVTTSIIFSGLMVLSVQSAQAGLVAYYQFDNATQLGVDSSGNNNTAEALYGPAYTPAGYQNGAVALNGDSFLRAPVDVGTTAMPQMTWGAWVKTDVIDGGVRAVLSADSGGFDRNINYDLRGGSSSWSSFTGNGVLGSGITPTTDWTFVAAVYNESSSTVRLYVNDTVVETTTAFGESFNFFDIGHNPCCGEFFIGQVDNVFVFDEALTDSQVKAIHSNGIQPVPLPASAWLMGLSLAVFSQLNRRR